MLNNPCNIVSPLLKENFSLNFIKEPVLSGKSRVLSWRQLQLKRFRNLISRHEDEVLEALSKDLGKPKVEAFYEIIALRQELKLAERNLKQWMAPRKVHIPLVLRPGEAMIRMEPLGCVLIIGPWNYPFSLTLQPLISALAAGNTAVIKPSENAPATSALIAKTLPKYFPPEIVTVCEGDETIASQLVSLPFDHIFFTGSGNIGKKIMKAASENLTPITLELGGQSPALVIDKADISITAKRLIWGKGLNSGQTCIAPNHLLVQEDLLPSLLDEMKKTLQNFYGLEPLDSPHLASIINKHHFKRLEKLLQKAIEKNQVLYGGKLDANKNLITPTLLKVDNVEDPLLKEELFGPLLPILPVKDLDVALESINKLPKPLAIYMFGGGELEQQKLLNRTSSGGVCFNDVVLQCGIPSMPFGGVGPSGIGRYHGLSGFETFSNQKSILKRPFWLDLQFRYPPYKSNIDLIRKILG